MKKVRRQQKTATADYHQRDRLETEGYGEVQSAFFGETGNQDGATNLFERVLDRANLNAAYLQVVRNKGGAGVDGMSCDQLLPYLRTNKVELLERLRHDNYEPMPVRLVAS